MLDFALRAVTEQDTSDLQHFCWPQYSASSIKFFLQRCITLMSKQQGFALIAEQESKAVAFGSLTKWTGVGEIADLTVAPTLRGQGVGTALIRRLSKEAMCLGCYQLEIGVARNNPRARALYERLGFAKNRAIEIDFGSNKGIVDYLTKPLKHD